MSLPFLYSLELAKLKKKSLRSMAPFLSFLFSESRARMRSRWMRPVSYLPWIQNSGGTKKFSHQDKSYFDVICKINIDVKNPQWTQYQIFKSKHNQDYWFSFLFEPLVGLGINGSVTDVGTLPLLSLPLSPNLQLSSHWSVVVPVMAGTVVRKLPNTDIWVKEIFFLCVWLD